MTPAVNLNQTVYRLEANDIVSGDSLLAKKIVSRESYNLSLTANTKVYGTIYPNKFGVTGLRHEITPSVQYSSTPEIRRNIQYFSYTGVGVGSRRAKVLSYSLGNVFRLKYLSDDKEKNIDLFNLNFSSGYDFAALKRKMRNLSSNLRTTAIPHLDIT